MNSGIKKEPDLTLKVKKVLELLIKMNRDLAKTFQVVIAKVGKPMHLLYFLRMWQDLMKRKIRRGNIIKRNSTILVQS